MNENLQLDSDFNRLALRPTIVRSPPVSLVAARTLKIRQPSLIALKVGANFTTATSRARLEWA